VEARAAELQATLGTPQLEPSPVLAEASGAAVTALVGVISTLNLQLEQLTEQLQRHLNSTRTPRSCAVSQDSV
jgi:hypothetical protein